MRIPNAVHESRGWVLSRIAADFDLLDVWALPVEGERDELVAFLEQMAGLDPLQSGALPSRVLFWVRLQIGQLLGWDDGDRRPIPGCTEVTLLDRLPADLDVSAELPAIGSRLSEVAGGFRPLFRTDDEWAAEISNATVHGVMQLTWVERDNGRYGANLAVYVKPRGLLGSAYMRLIDPFRQLIVYPSLLRHVGKSWESRFRG